MKIVLVRHGQTEWNKKDLFRGRVDIPLDETGLQQAVRVGQRLAPLGLHIEAMYSSPLQRAMQTAEAIANKLGVHPVKSLNDFIEFDYGQWEGHSPDEIRKKYPQEYRYWIHDPDQLKIPGGETLQQVKERVKRGLDVVMQESKDKNMVIVAHKAINKIIIGLLLGLQENDSWEMEQDLACINIFEIIEGKVRTDLLNDIIHLKKT